MRPWSLIVALVATLVLGTAASAAEVRGVLSKVDLDRHEVVVEARGRGVRGVEFTFSVDAGTKILFGDEPGQLADLAVGKHVRVSFQRQGRDDMALLIQAHGSPPARPATTPAAPNVPGDAITGVLRRVAYTEREIVVVGPGPKGPETETTLAVPDRVQVLRGDRTIRFDDLKEGEQVAVTAEKRDGRLTATAIYAGGAKPPAADTMARQQKQEKLMKVLQIAGQVMQVIQQMRANRP